MPLETKHEPPYYTIDEDLPIVTNLGIKYIYRATLTQTSTNDPVATADTNNTLNGIVWTRSATGTYLGTLTAAFPTNKTFITTAPAGTGLPAEIQCFRSSADTINLKTYDLTGTEADDRLTDWSITITITI